MENFDFNTIQNFDDHIQKSIPNYDVLMKSIKSISEYFFVKGENIYDLGCSTGVLLKSLKCDCTKIGYDSSNLLPNEPNFKNVDLNNPFEIKNACLIYSIFTMQFLNPNKRLDYLKNIYTNLNNGGALIICEKVYQQHGIIQEIISFSHYDYKLNSFSSDEIISKERDLRFIMKPCTDAILFDLLVKAGFRISSVFWQMFNFKGIIAIKQ